MNYRRFAIINMKKLSELGVIIIGGQIITRVIADLAKGDEVVDANRKTIVAKTISNGYINEEGVVVNDYKTTVDEKKLTQEGDIIVKLSAPYNAAIIDKEHEGMLVSSFCSIIRKTENIDKRYLVAFLNSNIAQKQLENSVSGTMMSILSNGKLNDLRVLVPSNAKQKEIGEFFEKTIKNRTLLQKIIKLEDEKLASLIMSLEE